MDPFLFADLHQRALLAAQKWPDATQQEREEMISTLSNNPLVVRETAIREHLQSCSNHFSCGWQDVRDPGNPRDEASWTPRAELLETVADGIRNGQIQPWLPTVPPSKEQLQNPDLFPFYRPR